MHNILSSAKVVLSLILTFVTFSSMGQTGTLYGFITAVESEATLDAVSVYILETGKGGITNARGQYVIRDVNPGRYTLQASFLGYSPISEEIIISAGDSVRTDLRMNESVLDLPPVVIRSISMTGGKSGLRELPGSADFISPKELSRFNHTDINRVLRSVPGVNIQEEDGFGLRPNIGLRGTGTSRSSKITLMEDGILIAPAPYSAPAAYYMPMIGRMRAAEILKGSSQIKYGPYTTGGAINLISSQIPDEFSGHLTISGGSFGNRNMHTWLGNSHKNFSYLVEAFTMASNGFKEPDNADNAGFTQQDFLAKFRLNTNEGAYIYQSLTLKLAQSTQRSKETYLGLSREDFFKTPFRLYSASRLDEINSEHTHVTLTHFAKLSKHLNITSTIYRSDFFRNWYKLHQMETPDGSVSLKNLLNSPANYPEEYEYLTGETSPDDRLTVRANKRTYYTQGLQTIMGVNFKTGFLNHQIDFGFRHHIDQMDRFQHQDHYRMANGIMQMTTAGLPGAQDNRIESASANATYIQYKLGIGNLSVTPGLRYEHIELKLRDYRSTYDPNRTGENMTSRSNKVNAIMPGIGLNYFFNSRLSIFSGIHKGFSPPGTNPETLPEESVNYESGARYTGRILSAKVIVFYNDYKNLLGRDLAAAGGGGTLKQFNGGSAEVKGIEFSGTYDLLNGNSVNFILPLTLTYTLTDARFRNSFNSGFDQWGTVTSGDELPYQAKHQFAALLAFEHYSFNFNLNSKYMSDMRDIAGQGRIPDEKRIPGFLVIDASAAYKFFRQVSFFANINNLGNKLYIAALQPSGLRPGMPRSVNVGLSARF